MEVFRAFGGRIMRTVDQRAETFGPVLYFRGAERDAWRVAALIGISDGASPPGLTCDADVAAPMRLGARNGLALWRYDVTMPRAPTASSVRYRIGDRAWGVAVPGSGGLRIAFTSCNGDETSAVGASGDIPDRNERWRHMTRIHRDEPFNLLVQGGDQIYADPVWRNLPSLRRLLRPFGLARQGHQFEASTATAVSDFFFNGYTHVFSQADVRDALATIPSAMMWDDHDIYDGYGSHPPSWRHSRPHQGVYEIAREHFRLFQLALGPDETASAQYAARGDHFGWCHCIGDVGILAPDLRSTRRFEQVMSTENWSDTEGALAGLSGCRIVFLVSTVPLVNLTATTMERAFGLCPGFIHAHNDLRDQWQSYRHRHEWRRMLTLLLDFSDRTGAQVIVLSGEIHLAAMGRAQRSGTTLWQLISSGVVHPPLPSMAVRLISWLAGGRETLPGGITTKVDTFPGTRLRYSGARNWLALDVPERGPLTAAWHLEHDPAPKQITLVA